MLKNQFFILLLSLMMFNHVTHGMEYGTINGSGTDSSDPGWENFIRNPPQSETLWHTFIQQEEITNVLVKKDPLTNSYNAHDKPFYMEAYPSQSKLCDIKKYVFIVSALRQFKQETTSKERCCCCCWVGHHSQLWYQFENYYTASIDIWPKDLRNTTTKLGLHQALNISPRKAIGYTTTEFSPEDKAVIAHILKNKNVK